MTVSAEQAVRLIEKAAERERNDRFLRDIGWAILGAVLLLAAAALLNPTLGAFVRGWWGSAVYFTIYQTIWTGRRGGARKPGYVTMASEGVRRCRHTRQ